jgi:uncharacterized membrane protein
MENRSVGYLIILVAILIGFIIYSFNVALADIVSTACSHGASCPMWGTISFQTNVSLAIMAFVVLIGVYLIFFGKDEKVVTRVRTVKRQAGPKKPVIEDYRKVMGELGKDERTLLEEVVKEAGTVFQSSLVEKSGFSKVRVTRGLDRLEGRGLIERKRRGMTNVVILRR